MTEETDSEMRDNIARMLGCAVSDFDYVLDGRYGNCVDIAAIATAEEADSSLHLVGEGTDEWRALLTRWIELAKTIETLIVIRGIADKAGARREMAHAEVRMVSLCVTPDHLRKVSRYAMRAHSPAKASLILKALSILQRDKGG